MIVPQRETLVRGKPARRAVKDVTGKSVSNATVWRWMLHGVRGHVLESIVIGGGRYTSVEAIRRHHAAMNERKLSHTPNTANRRVSSARRALDAMGV